MLKAFIRWLQGFIPEPEPDRYETKLLLGTTELPHDTEWISKSVPIFKPEEVPAAEVVPIVVEELGPKEGEELTEEDEEDVDAYIEKLVAIRKELLQEEASLRKEIAQLRMLKQTGLTDPKPDQ